MNLKYDFRKENEIVFHFGDQGDRFYFLVEGFATVLVPVLKPNLDPSIYLNFNYQTDKFERKFERSKLID